LKIDGQTGPASTPAGRAGWFRVQSSTWGGVTRPSDPQSGQPTTTKVVEPFRVTRQLDGASAFLYEAMKGGTVLAVTIASDEGTTPSTTWQLRSAKVIDIVLSAAVGGANAVSEVVELIYGEVVVTHEATKRSFTVTGGVT
jgi:type VI protein secretion system component Hcp